MTESPTRVEVHRRVVLPALVVLTVVTGVVDAVSLLGLGQVFVAVMTGNVVFVGLGLAGAQDVPLLEPAVALAAFLVGAAGAGRVINRRAGHRGRVLFGAVAVKLAFALCAVLIAAVGLHEDSRAARVAMIVLMSAGMAVQNAGVRRLGIPDFTTTLLTMTLTGLAAESRLAGGRGGQPVRRLTSVVALAGGAFVGAVLVLNVGLAWPMALVACLLVLVLAVTGWNLRRTVAADWEVPRP